MNNTALEPANATNANAIHQGERAGSSDSTIQRFNDSTGLLTSLFAVPLADRPEFERLPGTVRELINNRFTIFNIIHSAQNKRRAAKIQSQAFGRARGYSATTLLDLYYRYVKTHDWRTLIDGSRAKEYSDASQPPEFIKFWLQLVASHKRSIAQARAELLRIWTTGFNDQGKRTEVPGYSGQGVPASAGSRPLLPWQQWYQHTHPGEPLPLDPPIPSGWGQSQLYRHVDARKTGQTQLALAREGSAAARKSLPSNLTTRVGLRFLELITFDDVKVDWRVIDTRTGEVCDLWLLVAIDRATGLVLGYWMRPALKREDGSQQHLTLRDMKQLCGWVLFTWGLPPYVVTWRLERGTATVAEATALAIQNLFNGRIEISHTSMIGGKAPSGYQQRAVGNARGKANHEATNNLLHNVCDNLPGQTGPTYLRRPSDLAARERHAIDTWTNIFCELPADLRDKVAFPICTLPEARAELDRRFNWMNARTDHALEGYDWTFEWRQSPQHNWESIYTLPVGIQPAPENRRKRKHSPLERAHILRAQTRNLGDWTPGTDLAPSLVRIYDTHRKVTVTPAGEIEFLLDGKKLTFMAHQSHSSPPSHSLQCGSAYLAFYNEQFPDFIHLAHLPPHGGYVCTCALRERGRDGDREALAQSLQYTAHARAEAERKASELAAPEAARIADIEHRNVALLTEARAKFAAIDATPIAPLELGADGGRAQAHQSRQSPPSHSDESLIASSIAAAEKLAAAERRQARREEREEEDLAALAKKARRQDYKPAAANEEESR
jgi:hypothetical protein